MFNTYICHQIKINKWFKQNMPYFKKQQPYVLKIILYTMSLTYNRCFHQFPADYENCKSKQLAA